MEVSYYRAMQAGQRALKARRLADPGFLATGASGSGKTMTAFDRERSRR